MGRKAKVDSPTVKHITLPTSVTMQAELLLFSEVEGKVPYGAWSGYVESLIRKDLQSKGISL